MLEGGGEGQPSDNRDDTWFGTPDTLYVILKYLKEIEMQRPLLIIITLNSRNTCTHRASCKTQIMIEFKVIKQEGKI